MTVGITAPRLLPASSPAATAATALALRRRNVRRSITVTTWALRAPAWSRPPRNPSVSTLSIVEGFSACVSGARECLGGPEGVTNSHEPSAASGRADRRDLGSWRYPRFVAGEDLAPHARLQIAWMKRRDRARRLTPSTVRYASAVARMSRDGGHNERATPDAPQIWHLVCR